VPKVATAEAVVVPVARKTSAKETVSVRSFALGLTASFFLLELVNILHHGMWRDEIQVWSLSQRCHSLLEFLRLKRYEDLGHPDAWHLLVYPVSRFTSNPVAMQLVHLVVATITAYIVARYAPFPRLQRVLIVFGYFLFFEYATISRGYAFGVLCVFWFCAAFKPGAGKNYLKLAAILSLMAQANVHALMLALAFAAMLMFEVVWSREPRRFLFPGAGQAGFAAMLFAAAVLASIFRMRPPADSAFYPAWHLGLDPTSVGRTLAMMWKSFVPIPQLSRHFWNTNIVPSPMVVAALSIPVLCVSVLFFVRKPTVLFLYAAGIGELLLFRHVKYAGDLRHDGHGFILFLACAWLAYGFPDEKFPLPKIDGVARWFAPYKRGVFVGLLVVQVTAALIASAIALKVPFSQAKNTANFLRANHLDKMFILGEFDAPLATVAGYLGRDIYYPRGDRMGTYVIWDTKRLATPKKPMLELGKEKAAERHEDVLVILNHPSPVEDASAQEIASFTGSVVGSEDYYIYRARYEPQTTESVSR
jgi:hypothetical protein